MGIGGRIENQAAGSAASFLDPGHQFAFNIALAKGDIEAELLCPRPAAFLKSGQGFAAVNIGFAQPKHVQIGPVDDKNRFHECAYRRSSVLREAPDHSKGPFNPQQSLHPPLSRTCLTAAARASKPTAPGMTVSSMMKAGVPWILSESASCMLRVMT